MTVQTPERPATVVSFAANKGRPDATMLADDSGRTIVAMLQKAADMAKNDCARAMDLAHKLTFQLRAAEERARELEAEAAHFRDRAAHAEDWLVRIHSEVEQTFFQKEERTAHERSSTATAERSQTRSRSQA
jgi:predicted  nucleic acid-binding Zn-ribbon protein